MSKQIFTNGTNTVEKVKDFSRHEDGFKDGMINFVFMRDVDSGETLLRTKSEFEREFHVVCIGEQGKSVIEDAMTKASNENGMILVVKSNTLPSEAMSKEVDLKGKVLIASVIGDNKEDIERQLIKLNFIDEFDKSKSDTIVELATDILAHHGDLELD